MRSLTIGATFTVGLAAMGLVHCGMSANDSSLQPEPPGNSNSGTGSATTGSSSSGGGGSGFGGPGTGTGGSGPPPPPPEVEVEKAFEAPVATQRFVWAANPKTGRVAIIDSKTYQVKTVAAGQGPTFIAAIPGKEDSAIVLNVLSNDATYLSAIDERIDTRTFRVAPRANAWAISPDAHFAIAWTDVSHVAKPDKIDGFQQVSIIDLRATGASSAAPVRTVGFRPSSISFSADGSRAFAVTEDGITVLDLAAPADPKIVRTIRLDVPSQGTAVDAGATGANDAAAAPPVDSGATVLDAGANGDAADAVAVGDGSTLVPSPPDAAPIGSGKPNVPPVGGADVSITPDGKYAVLRREGSRVVTVIDLADGSRWSWTLSGPITDLDLADTGKVAVAVVRNESRVAILPVPGMGSMPSDMLISGETVGSVVLAPKGDSAVLYTNAVAVNRITVLQMAPTPRYEVIDLHAPVLSVFPSPTAQHAIVIHDSLGGTAFQSPGAFSIVPMTGDQAPVIQPTDAVPLSVAMSPTGDRALVPVRNDTSRTYGVYLASMPSLVTTRYALASPPATAGFVGSDGQAFIAQEHPEGRVTFIDSTTGLVRTITGFELGASVVVWSRDGGQ